MLADDWALRGGTDFQGFFGKPYKSESLQPPSGAVLATGASDPAVHSHSHRRSGEGEVLCQRVGVASVLLASQWHSRQ